MASKRHHKPLRRWFWRIGGVILISLVVTGGLFWLRLSANEAPIILPTFVAQVGLDSNAHSSAGQTVPLLNPRVTFTPIPTLTNTPPPGATLTPTPTATPIPTQTPTSVPVPTVRVEVFLPTEPTPFAVSTPVEAIELPDGVTNILLIGGDELRVGDRPGTERTDALIIVSVNREAGTASMMSIPRDIYLYIPGWIESRINTAYAHGNAVDYPGGGVKLLKDTILYNFGIPIHYYAKVDFAGFEEIIDTVGGIEIINSCSLRDWQLKEPGLDINVEENWQMVVLEPGVHQMDGFEALWYARSRRSTSDFDRGRRQQQVLRALLNKGVDFNLMPQIPILWGAFQETVETDMDIGKLLQLAAMAPQIRANGIQHLYFTQGEIEYRVTEGGADVLGLNPEVARRTLERLYSVPELNRTTRLPIAIEILNHSGRADMGEIAADNARWFGFEAVVTEPKGAVLPTTQITYHRLSLKGSYDWLISWLFSVGRSAINIEPQMEADFLYQVTLGEDYQSCRNPLYAPRP